LKNGQLKEKSLFETTKLNHFPKEDFGKKQNSLFFIFI